MPDWADDEGRYFWSGPNNDFTFDVQIPHAPICGPRPGCDCDFCIHDRNRVEWPTWWWVYSFSSDEPLAGPFHDEDEAKDAAVKFGGVVVSEEIEFD